MKLSEGIRPTLRKKVSIGSADFRAEKRVIQPTLRFVDVEICGHHVEVASQDHLITSGEKVRGVLPQPFEPTKLVIELRSRRRIAVRQVQASD
jgi:hypothetical protein